MFTRTHTINGVVYTEALEAYSDPVTRKPKHRCLVRWPASMSLVEAIADAEGIASLCSRALPRYRSRRWRISGQCGRSIERPCG